MLGTLCYNVDSQSVWELKRAPNVSQPYKTLTASFKAAAYILQI